MAFQAGAVTAVFEAEISKFQKSIQEVQNSMKAMAKQANAEFDKMGKQGAKNMEDFAESVKSKAGSALTGLVGIAKNATMALGAGLFGLGAASLKVASDFESMKMSLKTAFGGVQADADKAFGQIKQFAASTPYQMSEVLNAFIKLKNMGLDPSQRALTAYGDTASSMGKSLNDMVEAVADAATGEFERLKEFGIRASSEGDRVKFTFKGVTTEVGKNSEEIQDYLIKLGETNFAGGMAGQATTLGGLMSTLQDTFAEVFNAIAVDSGLLDIAKNYVLEFGKIIMENKGKIIGFASGIMNAFALVTQAAKQIFDILFKGDYGMGPFGEDSKIVDNLFTFREVAIEVFKEVKKVFEDLKQAFIDGQAKFDEFTDWAKQNKEPLIAIGAALGTMALGFTLVKLASMAYIAVMGVVNIVTGAFAGIMAFLTSPITLVIVAIGLLVGAIVYLWRNNEQFRDIVLAIWQGIQLAVATTINWVIIYFKWLQDAWAFTIAAIQTHWEFLKGIWNMGVTFISGIINWFVGYFTMLWNGIMTWFSMSTGEKINFIAYLFGYIVGWVISKVIEIGAGIMAWITSAYEWWIAYTTALPGRIGAFLQQVWDTFLNYLNWIGVSIVSLVTQAVTNWINIFVALPSQIGAQLQNLWNTMTEKVQGMVDGAKNVFDQIGDVNLFDIGKNIIDGLVGGLNSKLQEVKDKVKEIGDNVAKGFKDALGIQSPSRVLMEVGAFTTEGLEVGMLSRADQLESVVDEISGMAANITVPSEMQTGVANNQITNTNNNVFNMPQTSNPNQIVNMVIGKLNQMNNQARNGINI